MNLPFLVASASGVDATPEIIQILPISQQISQQRQQQQQQELKKQLEEEQKQRQGQEQEQEQQEQARQSLQLLHVQRRADHGGRAIANGVTPTGKGASPSIFEPYADAEVWEGQANPLRIQLDPQTFVVAAPSTAAAAKVSEIVSSAGPITYYVKTDGSTTLPSWLKFDTLTLEFSGTPPIGTYKRTTILTITIAASSVPGYTQATDRFTIKIYVHSLGLSTFPVRSCSASSLYYSQEWDRVWQSYLPDLVLERQQRHVNFQMDADFFRVDGCSQPARTAVAAAALSALPLNSNLSSYSTTTNESSSKKPLPVHYQAPYITGINMALSTETTHELSLFNNTLPSWLSFDHTNWTLTGDLPQGTPSRIILDVEVADSFNTSAVFKLQIFSDITPFSFLRTVPDVWVKRGELFNVDLLPASLLSYPAEVTVLPVEHKFLFEPIDITQSQTNASSSLNATITKLGKNPSNPLLNTSGIHNSSACSYTDLWGQQSENNREAGPSPLIPNWFNRTSFTSHLPSAPTSPTSSVEEGKIELQGHIPCEMILRVRWLVRNSLGQLASTEFMIWANDQGPPPIAKPHTDEPVNQHHSVGPIGVKIAVGIAVATPVLIAIWFMISRYCKRLRRQDGSIKPTGGDLEGGRIRPLSGSDDNGSSGLDMRSQRRRQPTTEVLPNGEPEYRSSYEDDPSVGHHDSFSEKYVAEHGPYIYTTTSGDEGEGSGSSKRTSILGWIFGDRHPGEEEMSAAAAAAEMNRRRMSEPLTFSLKRISVGYPFESNRFGFVNGNRVSLYDSGAGTSTDASSPSRPTLQNNTAEPSQVVSDTKPSSKPPSESAPKKLSNRSSSIFKKGSKRLSKLMKDKDAINDHATKRDATAATRQLGVDSAYQTVRPCHSFLSTGTGYMASMSECNTSIDDRQDSGRNSDEEIEEDRRVDRSNADKESQRPWTPSTFLMKPQGLRPNREVEFVGGSEESETEYRGLSEGIRRSDSGALMTESSSMAFSEPAKDSSRNTKAPPSIKTSFLDLGRASSAPPPLLSSWTYNLQIPGTESDRDSTVSLSSTRTAPVTGSEVLFTKERQSSVHAGPGSFQRRSIVEFLKSHDDPISPLSAFSASLPSWPHIAESSSQGKGKGTLRGSVSSSQEESSASDENRDSIYSIGQEGPHETTKWMVVPSNQTFRSVSVRKNNNKDQKETSEWISDLTCESEMAKDTGKSVDRNRDEYDQRHRSIPYELGTVESSPLPPTQMSVADCQPVHDAPAASPSVLSLNDTSLVTTPVAPASPPPRSTPASHNHSLSSGFSHISSIHSQLPLTRHSMDRMRPVSYPILTTAPIANAVIPRRFVKATIGSAFHSTSSIRDPMASSPSSPRMMAQHTSLSRAMSPPPMSPPLLPSSPSPMSPRSSIFFGDASTAPLPGEYRAYLVSDPNDVAQAQDQQQTRGGHHHRPSASLSSIDIERADLVARPRRKLPEWIQFNNKMRSLWGRPIPGTAGEWQVSMVQTQLVHFSATATATTPTTPTPSAVLSSFPSAAAFASGSVVTGGQHPTLGQQQAPTATAAEAGVSLESAVEGEQQQIKETTVVQGEEHHTQDIEVELVVLLVREPSEAPLSPPLGATRSRTIPSLAQVQDQAQLQQVKQLPPVSSSSLSLMSSFQTAPSLPTLNSPPVFSISQDQSQSTMTPVAIPAVVEMAAKVKESAKPSPVSPVSPVSPLPDGASASAAGTPSPSASPPYLQQQQQSYSPSSTLKAVSTTTNSAASSPGQSPPRSSSGGSSSGGPGRAVGQRVLAERRRIEAMMLKSQQGL
ncbi:hypothetical protein BGZ96_010416 [Linnemannia gamsii]|uniref:Dystroglycan-type cadherin-like domain-containing protein n=1 Tax=Linnemannia gamsii TaxID=64522 RepID=A0ABQ7KBY5_9FUNG|nr:hypothetical protein BGZ96_010416 [Linnemannia gamsii]